mmetsp:Transcript_15096/g.19260  ORF Transcript_15096/g.19260 Transcript_15096/m.19260 type:complete len:104 (-) Transcript_15096:294-605(-)
MRAPTGGVSGWLAMKIMETNASSTREAIRRLELNQNDTFVELGTGHGESLRRIAEMDSVSIPKRIVCVEISSNFRNELQKKLQNYQPNYQLRYMAKIASKCLT